MTKHKQQMILRQDKPARPGRSGIEAQVMRPPSQGLAATPVSRLQRQVGNQAVQRMLAQRRGEADQQKTPESTLFQGGVPGVKGSGKAALVADVLTVLDTGLTVAELGIPAVEGIGASVLGAGTFAAGISLLASVGFVVASLYGLAEAYKTGDKWAAVMGQSYAILYCAHGQKPPSAPAWMKAGPAFNAAAESARKRISDAVKAKGKSAYDMLNVLLAMRREPEKALNQIYQHLVKENLQVTFIVFKVGGRLYQVAKSYKLTWPAVKAVSE
jgi:hypothetical protein